MRVGVLGGTFNPIHLGHLRVAEEAREAAGLDKVIFMPTFLTPHKADEVNSPAKVRSEMIRMAIAGNKAFELSDMEIKRGGVSYTIDTVRELIKTGGKDTEVDMIVGADAFSDISSWCDFETLFTLASFIVVGRPGFPAGKPNDALPVELAGRFWYDNATGAYMNYHGNSLVYVNGTLLDISSSDIRKRVKTGCSIRYLVPDEVERYIRSAHLYR
ncbi:MAG: nicotinate-nucleotide adenylyltransferase [Deltaproteobacteria bacterium]|nr:nicotinate-nucleotide adenylyltransferase [Deltaproteobacteria bacterium]